MENSIVEVRLTEDDKKIVQELISSDLINVRTPGDALLWALRNYKPPRFSAKSLPIRKEDIFAFPGISPEPAPTALIKKSRIRLLGSIIQIPGSHRAKGKL